ncbi:MAG: DNA translocase FtsK [Clostridiales Family XIII bacterium]|jgi:S-DNA-T family DNA segregation ATPase FtsK/SpoIIIE|nr:DNA translocase FtsK [Clostridiales Family XIII bacterium]
MAVSGKKTTRTKTKKTSASGRKPAKNTASSKENEQLLRSRLREDISAIVSVAVGAFLIFALFVAAAGKVGVGVSVFLKGCFGGVAYVLPFAFIVCGVWLFMRRTKQGNIRSIVLIVLIFVVLQLIGAAYYLRSGSNPLGNAGFGEIFDLSASGESGGIVGMYIGALLVRLIGKAGLYIFSVVVLLIALLLLFNTPLSPYVRRAAEKRAEARAQRDAAREEDEAEEADRAFETGASDAREEPEPGTEPGGRGLFAGFGRRLRGGNGGSEGAGTEDFEPSPKRARNRANIIETVKQGAILADDDADPDRPEGDDEEAAETGFGLEPPFRGGPGIGLDRESDTGWPQALGLDPEARSDGDLPADAREDTLDAGFGGVKDEPFTEADIGANPADRSPAAKSLRPSAFVAGAVADTGFGRSEALDNYKLPPVNLLNKGPKAVRTENAQELKFKARKLEKTLSDFKVDANVINVTVGPTVTRYEVEPDVGVKIQSIKSLEPDLALKLEVKSVRVVPMPGQAVIGIEAYNANTNIVTLREIIDSPEFRAEDSKIAFVLGKNISGKRIIADLNNMPHLLIAGTTGSGKSVCINSILLSILYRAKPDEVKLILVDPKVVELKSYNDIPHLLVPVVTDPERAATALNYAVTLMNERYKKFAEYNVRNLDGYNGRLKREGRLEDVLPRIVIVIDELSDLMMIAPAKVQESISRLAAMARAAGMHLIVATQQPLASILTSVIKANIPSRIAFSVSSNSASRVILDESGAERLHGNGDMLFSPVGTREPMRIQGSFVSDSEVHKVTDYIKKEMDPAYSPDVLQAVSGEVTGQLVDDEDDLFRDAVEMVVGAKQASVSMIQRRFRIGYNRAARLVDMMEERGIVAASDGTNKPRKVLMGEAQLGNFLGSGAALADDAPPFDIGDGDD